MRRGCMGLAVATSLVIVAGVAWAVGELVVGGKAMFPTKDIIDNAVHSADHTTLVAAIKAAGLVQTLKGPAVHGVCTDERGVQRPTRRNSRESSQA
jgi:hypothetical protein